MLALLDASTASSPSAPLPATISGVLTGACAYLRKRLYDYVDSDGEFVLSAAQLADTGVENPALAPHTGSRRPGCSPRSDRAEVRRLDSTPGEGPGLLSHCPLAPISTSQEHRGSHGKHPGAFSGEAVHPVRGFRCTSEAA